MAPNIPPHISLIFFFFTTITIYSSTCTDAVESGLFRNDSSALTQASTDYGNIIHEIPSSVLYPSSVNDIIDLIKSSNENRPVPITVAAKGQGHSVRGQAMAGGGVVVEMSSLSGKSVGIRVFDNYVDVGGEQLWIDVLKATLERGVAPVTWTDYLYLSVGGTLSNGGIGGQAFLRGPQINNVLELDVVTGKGEFITCSPDRNPELFFGVLGGLGQFGIITRARIIIEKAPTRAKWVRLVYSDFSTFTRDQEHLISSSAPNYVEGILITNENTTNEWRSLFSSPSLQSDVVALFNKQHILYSIELVKYYDNQTANTIDKDFEMLINELNFIPGFIFSTDVSFFDFLNRVGNLDNPHGPLESHPWLNLFIPKSRITDFNAGVLATMVPSFNQPSSLYLFYPFNRKKWDDRMSAVIPADEDIFYTIGILHTSQPNEYQLFDKFNNDILIFCEKSGIQVKQYLPYYTNKQDWIKHYGSKWGTIQQRKALFDPRMILSPGQRIFNSV